MKYKQNNGDPFTKEQFLKQLESNSEFNGIFGTNPIDQIKDLIHDIRTNPDSRRLMVNAWSVGEIDDMTLPPCHYGFQVYTRELTEAERIGIIQPYGMDTLIPEARDKFMEEHNIPTRAISLKFNMRSSDTFLGLPFNIASYGLLLEILAKEVNMVPGELIGSLGDTHLYRDHTEQAREQIGEKINPRKRCELATEMGLGGKLPNVMAPSSTWDLVCDELGVPKRTREPYPLPRLLWKSHLKDFDSIIDILRIQDFVLVNYKSHPHIKAKLSN